MKRKLFGLFLILIISFLLVGCKSTKEVENSETYEIKEEKGKVVIVVGDGTGTHVYYHDKKKVTDYEKYLNFHTHEAAEEMYDIYKQAGTFDNKPEIDSVSVKGEYLVYNYNEAGYNGVTTYDELVAFAKTYGVTVK